MKHYFNVNMTCSGCENSIKRLLIKKNKDLNIETNIDKQTLIVEGEITEEEIINTLKKWCEASKKEIKVIDKI